MNPQELTLLQDAELIERYQDGDHQAFKVLLERYNGKVFTTILMIVKDRYLAEDLTQEAFIKVIKQIRKDKYNHQGKFGPWVCRIGHNLAIDHTRKRKRRPTITMDNGEALFDNLNFTEENYETRQAQRETSDFVKELVKRLPQEQREVLVLRHYSDMTFKEIAEVTGVSINTALGRMRYAIINLRKEIDKLKNHDADLYPKRRY